MTGASLKALAKLAGVNCNYQTYDGVQVSASYETITALLECMGFPAATLRQTRESCARLSAIKRSAIPPLIIADHQHAPAIPLNKTIMKDEIEWRLTREDGATLAGRSPTMTRGKRRFFEIPAQPQGYHVIEASGARAHLLCAPERCWSPDCLTSGQKIWGVSAQAYALRSANDFGIGGFSEIAELAKACGARGASFLGLSPLHALFSSDRTKRSPYSPSNRLMIEPLFIDPCAIPGFEGTAAHAQVYEAQEFKADLGRVRDQCLIDHQKVWAMLRRALEPLWHDFRDNGRLDSFNAFQTAMGPSLQDHALFEALSERFCAQGLNWSGAWPQQFQARNSPSVNAARHELSDAVSFHAWLQWIADQQLQSAAQAASDSGMEIGLYRDLAVGADRFGSEAWRDPSAILSSASIGAPPDPLGPQGQNWGLPPLDPHALALDGLHAFRELVRANIRHSGAIRIDHAFQLERLFLIPNGMDPNAGAYVDYPFEALLACLRIESHRAKALVIAEDLGTAPPGFSRSIMQSGLLSYRLLLFERDGDGRFLPPQSYPEHALASITTHDLPTFQGWRRGLDIDMRDCFFCTADTEEAHALRARDRKALDEAFASQNLLADEQTTSGVSCAAFRFLARTPTKLLTLQLDDIVNETQQANLPGPERGYPNWRRRMKDPVARIARDDGPLAHAAACMAAEGRGIRLREATLASAPPQATYRLQFNANFTFNDAAKLAPYFAQLGITHIYASPIFASAPGSSHGYDVIDYAKINPVLGGESGFIRLSAALRDHSLKLLVDHVPNHMAKSIAPDGENQWWLSVLEAGRQSPYARVFDIDWGRAGCNSKIMLPVLNEPVLDAIRSNKIRLCYEPERSRFWLEYESQRFPLALSAYSDILVKVFAAYDPNDSQNLALFIDNMTSEARLQKSDHARETLAKIIKLHPDLVQIIDHVLSRLNSSVTQIEALLRRQHYRLAHWRTADSILNVRRFFDVNSLAGIRIEDPWVFDLVHTLLFDLIDKGHIHGLRIDHIDGLADPEAYLERLQQRVGPGFLLIVEKILEAGETLPKWPASGTTGYEALNQLDGIFVAKINEENFNSQYASARHDDGSSKEQITAIKIDLLQNTFKAELDSLTQDTVQLATGYDLTDDMIRGAWTQLIAQLPQYRTYLVSENNHAASERLIKIAISEISKCQRLDRAIVFVGDLLLRPKASDKELRLRTRFEQLSGPVMAKSLEDTWFYRNARFVALNEVGGDPDRFGMSLEEFHARNEQRLRNWPYNLLATQTHDAKRGEDLRARLLALSHRPDIWRELREAACVGADAPDSNDRYFLLQNIIGAWPVCDATGEPEPADSAFIARLQTYATKAAREAKRRSSWKYPDRAYEEATHRWIEKLCTSASFSDAVQGQMGILARAGFSVSLSRTALKLALPGIPDFYQGSEGADYALVDPDNRRPVDYGARACVFEKESATSFSQSKQLLITRVLQDRLAHQALYTRGDYEPLNAADGWVAFRRSCKSEALLLAARLDPFSSSPAPAWAIEDDFWRNLLPSSAFDWSGGDCVSGAVIILKNGVE